MYFDDLGKQLVLEVVRIDVDDREVLIAALARLLGGMRKHDAGVELLDPHAPVIAERQFHDISLAARALIRRRQKPRRRAPPPVAAQLEPAIADAFAGREVVFVAVPRTDEMHVGLGEFLPHEGPIGRKHVLDLVHDHALAGRATLVHAQIFVGVELALPAEHADLDVAVKHDAAAAVLERRGLACWNFSHAKGRAFIRTPRWLATKAG